MSKSKLHMAAGYVAAVLEGDEDTLDGAIKQALKGAAEQLDITLGIGSDEPIEPKKETTTGKEGSITEDDVYELLKDESKPGPTLVAKHFSISKTEATKLYKKVKSRLTKKTKPKADNMMTIIGGLPDGENLLVKAPYHLLMVLPKEVREQYIMGLDPKDVVDGDKMAEAAGDGADKTLVKEIDALKDVTPPTIPEDKLVDYKKYQKKILGWVDDIGADGGELWNIMSSRGLTVPIIKNLRTIAQSVQAGDI